MTDRDVLLAAIRRIRQINEAPIDLNANDDLIHALLDYIDDDAITDAVLDALDDDGEVPAPARAGRASSPEAESWISEIVADTGCMFDGFVRQGFSRDQSERFTLHLLEAIGRKSA